MQPLVVLILQKVHALAARGFLSYQFLPLPDSLTTSSSSSLV